MNQNRKDNDLQRAIDEITQKGGASAPRPAAPASQPAMPPAPAAPQMKMPTPAPAAPQMAMPAMSAMGGYGRPMSYGADISKVKEAALKELFPIMDRVEVEPEKRFLLYQEMLNTMRDKDRKSVV